MKGCGSMEDRLLCAWMEMALHIRGDRLVTGMSFNEMVVCSMLYRSMQSGQPLMTATDLGKATGLLKSQLNKVLNELEERGILERQRDQEDRRRVYLRLCEEQLSVYEAEHEKVMELVHQVCQTIGEEKAVLLSELLTEAVHAVKNTQK